MHRVLRPRFALSAAIIALAPSASRAGDSPGYRRDHRQSATGAEEIDVAALSPEWVRRSPAPPQTAWSGPAKWDAYAGIRGLRAMRNYDAAFGLAVAGDSVFLASSSDDSVVCLDLESSEERWRFFAAGPVRITPTIAEGRVHFGSDDGYAYCLRAHDGALLWKFRPPARAPLVLHNGRMISKWPCRSGVLVIEGTAYCAFSLLPWLPSFLCALDARTGQAEGVGRYVKRLEGATLEGAMVADATRWIVPQGRVSPRVFRRLDGESIGSLEGGGGSFLLAAPDGSILHGPGNKTGWVTTSNPATCKPSATSKGSNAVVLTGSRTVRLADHEVSAVDRRGKAIWKTALPHAQDLILNGETVFVGGRGEVVALDSKDGQRLWASPVEGDARLLVVANGALLVSTDAGTIHCFRRGAPPATPVRVAGTEPSAAPPEED